MAQSAESFAWPVRVDFEDPDAQRRLFVLVEFLNADTMKPAHLPETIFKDPES